MIRTGPVLTTLILVATCTAIAGCGAPVIDDPMATLSEKAVSPRKHEAAMVALDQTPADQVGVIAILLNVRNASLG